MGVDNLGNVFGAILKRSLRLSYFSVFVNVYGMVWYSISAGVSLEMAGGAQNWSNTTCLH